MAGNKAGGLKARDTNMKRHGADFYAKIGSEGGKRSGTGGFFYAKANGLDWHIKAGQKGGLISRRPKASDA